MSNYHAYFRSHNENNLYEVSFITDTASTAYTEVMMAGDKPFEVRYDNNNTPFDPVRLSKATISVVNNEYMEDIISPYAHGTRVILKDVNLNKTLWVGFLTPKIYSQEYTREYEVIDLEAEDCLSSLQYIPYTDDTAYTRSIVTIKSILDRICDECELTAGYYWAKTKNIGRGLMYPDVLKISEWNFFSADTDECWHLDEVLEEICRYFGYTCLQWGDRIYFIDNLSYTTNTTINSRWYPKPSYGGSTDQNIGTGRTITQDNVRSSGAQISFKPIYNKITVNANMNTCEDFIPSPFEDDYLTNRRGDFYSNYEVIPPSPARPVYQNGESWFSQRYSSDCDVDDLAIQSGDTKYRYFHRLYDNKYWDSVYYNGTTFRTNPTEVTKEQMGNNWSGVSCTTGYVGATLVDLGVVQKVHINEYNQTIVPSKLDYTRYLCVSQMGQVGISPNMRPVFKLKSGYHPPCFVNGDTGYLVINFEAIWERYASRPYVNPDWVTAQCKHGGGGQSITSDGNCYFKLRIGDKWWNGKMWKTAEEWPTTAKTFHVVTERTSDNSGTYNDARNTLNNVSWDDYINEEGYKIPLAGVDLLGDMEFEVIMPGGQYIYTSSQGSTEWHYDYNQYVWFKDLSIKCVQIGANGEEQEESDIEYENVIDTDAVSEFSNITVKITTYNDLAKPSYSNVIYEHDNTNTLLAGIKDNYLKELINNQWVNATARKPEENLILKYYNQYSTPTTQITMTLDTSIAQFDMVTGIDVDNPSKRFVPLSTQIDYKMGSQEITFEEIKRYGI